MKGTAVPGHSRKCSQPAHARTRLGLSGTWLHSLAAPAALAGACDRHHGSRASCRPNLEAELRARKVAGRAVVVAAVGIRIRSRRGRRRPAGGICHYSTRGWRRDNVGDAALQEPAGCMLCDAAMKRAAMNAAAACACMHIEEGVSLAGLRFLSR